MNERTFSIKIEKSPLETIRYEGKGTAANAKSIFKKLLRECLLKNGGDYGYYKNRCSTFVPWRFD